MHTAELRYVEVLGTQKNTSTYEWFEITNWALWRAKHLTNFSLKRMLTFKHPFTILPLHISFIGEYKIKQ